MVLITILGGLSVLLLLANIVYSVGLGIGQYFHSADCNASHHIALLDVVRGWQLSIHRVCCIDAL